MNEHKEKDRATEQRSANNRDCKVMEKEIMRMSVAMIGATSSVGRGRDGKERGRTEGGQRRGPGVVWMLTCALLLWGVFLGPFSYSQALAQEHKVLYGVVDFRQVLTSVSEGKRAMGELKSLIKSHQKERRWEQKKLERLTQKFEDSSVEWAEQNKELWRQKAEEIQNRVEQHRQKEAAFQQEVQEFETRVVQEIRKKMIGILSRMVKRCGLNMVFESSEPGVMYVDPDKVVDLTEAVIWQFSNPHPDD